MKELIIKQVYIIIQVNASKQSFILCAVYLAPDIDIDLFLENFFDIVNGIRSCYSYLPFFIGGDFNCRIANFNSLDENIFTHNAFLYAKRMSNDNFENKKGKVLSDFMEINDFFVCNGRSIGDSPEQFTFVSPLGKSIIDHVWCSFNCLSIVRDLKIVQIDTYSDHLPIVIFLFTNSDVNSTSKNQVSLPVSCKFVVRDSETEKFRDLLRWRNEVSIVSGEINELNNVLISTIKNAAVQLNLKKSSKFNSCIIPRNKPWFDVDCRKLKKMYVAYFGFTGMRDMRLTQGRLIGLRKSLTGI